jgi:hypothetical protein
MPLKSIPEINPVSVDSQLKVDGQIYRVHFGLLALASFEGATGSNPEFDGMSASLMNVAVLLYAGLMANHPDLTLEAVMAWFTPETSSTLCEFTWKAFSGSRPDPIVVDEGTPANPMSA